MAHSSHGTLRFTPLENGLDYLQSVVAHLAPPVEARDLKYAILHLAAAIEVLAKTLLEREHWTLVFERPELASRAHYAAGDFKSVNAEDALVRLEKIAEVSLNPKARKRMAHVAKMRNRLQHYGMVENAQAVQAVAADALDSLLNFIDEHFREPGDRDFERVEDALYFVRRDLGTIAALVKRRLAELAGDLDQQDTVVECPECRQMALVPGEMVRCAFCLLEEEPDQAASGYVSSILGVEEYSLRKDGGEWPLRTCPECGQETLVLDVVLRPRQQADGTGSVAMCFLDGITYDKSALDSCGRCGELFTSPDDPDERTGLCRDCWSEILSR